MIRGTTMTCSAPADCAELERRHSDGRGLLADGGASRGPDGFTVGAAVPHRVARRPVGSIWTRFVSSLRANG